MKAWIIEARVEQGTERLTINKKANNNSLKIKLFLVNQQALYVLSVWNSL